MASPVVPTVPYQAELQKFGEHIVAGDDQRLYEAIQDFGRQIFWLENGIIVNLYIEWRKGDISRRQTEWKTGSI